MASEVTAIDNRLMLLKTRFADRTASQLDDMLRNLRTWHTGEPTHGNLLALYQLLHRLSGSSGTFGFVALGRHASVLELRIKPLLERPDFSAAHVRHIVNADFIGQLSQLADLLQQGREAPPASVPRKAVVSDTQDTELLVLGEALTELATALTHYGFNTRHCLQSADISRQHWHENITIIALARHLVEISEWNRSQARRLQQKEVPILCTGEEDGFSSRYRLADLGASGLFTLPADVPRLAERIEQLSQERQQAGGGKVLLLDDDEELAEHYRLVLTNAGMDVRVMSHPKGLLDTLAEFRPDIVLMDIHMPPFSGVTLSRMIRFEPEWLSLPIIYLSSEQDRDQQLRALAQGADEFITKPISDRLLIRTVRILCYRARQLSKLVSCDGLTGLLNHSHIKQALSHEHARVQRLGHSTTVAMLDLDHFKSVNDTHGHTVGDRVIKALANLLQKRLRNTDHLGRYGGEEFVVILPECDLPQANVMFEEICHQFAELSFNSSEGEFRVTVSVGLANLNQFIQAEQVLNAADEALYDRKQRGRNGVSCYASSTLS
ncbi:diguanylate cyclase [Oceanisphaera sp. KMM 10153]|uniref:GGDEF domain-containing response regulator n=1 Tax=Oceanisphaera submarina TaxID=3390193 RepID=UPI00397615A7